MAQTRYPNMLPYMPSHNVNGASERMKEREKAHLARERNVDQDGKKVPSFPSPIRVEENDDGISAFVKDVLGDFTKFKRIMSTEKVPTCIGVVPVPATPTEQKSYFGSGNESKNRDKKRTLEKKREAKPTEKLESKSNIDPPKHKVHRSTEKINFAEYKAKEKKSHDAIELKLENKNRQTKGNSNTDKSNNCATTNGVTADKSVSPSKMSSEMATSGKGHEEKTTKNINKSEGSSESILQTSSKLKAEQAVPHKTRPVPIEIPIRDNNSASNVQNVHHNDMKVQNILKEMTATVAQPPLTGICTPILKKGFPFTKEKDDPMISDFKSPLHDDLIQKDVSKDEQGSVDGQEDKSRTDDCSRSSSSSCSSSSDESGSSDSECEDELEKHKSTAPKLSNLNAISPIQSLNSVSAVLNKSKVENVKGEKVENENNKGSESSAFNTGSTNVASNPDKKSENRLNSVDQSTSTLSVPPKDDITTLKDQNERKTPEKETLNVKSNMVEEENLLKSTFSERVSDEDKKSKNEFKEALKEESFIVNTDNSTNLNKLETKESASEKANDELDSKLSPSCLNKLNEENNSNETLKHKKVKEFRNDKDKREGEKKVSKVKLENVSDGGKKMKHKMKHKPSEQREAVLKKKVETSLKRTNFTKFNVQNIKPGLDNDSDDAEGEDSDVDVVSCESPVKKKKKEKCNGLNGHTKNGQNGLHQIPLDIEIVHDREKEPKSLLVRIDLSLLNRIPKKAIGHSRISVESTISGVELPSIGKDDKETTQSDKLEPERKIKKKENNVLNQEKSTEQTPSDKKKHVAGYGKRSPSFDNHQNKRLRRNSDRENSLQDRSKSRKTIAEQNAAVEEEIKKVSPDTHLQQAKTLKREADKLTDKEAKSRTYIEAIIHFICCGRALEDKEETEPRAAQMYSETEDLLKFVLKRVLAKSDDKRLIILCLRLQSLLLHKLYRVKSKQALKNSQILVEHFKATHKNNITSPYTTNKHASTPSPMSPTPSPAGSIGSIGSSSSSEGNIGSSHNGRPLPPTSTASVTSPVSISIPQRVHTAMSQHVSTTSKLLHSIDIWDTADNMASNYQEFFSLMDSQYGVLTFHSSIGHVVNYVKKSLSKLQDRAKGT